MSSYSTFFVCKWWDWLPRDENDRLRKIGYTTAITCCACHLVPTESFNFYEAVQDAEVKHEENEIPVGSCETPSFFFSG